MAIKIDNKDLSKRIYNWQEVQRVILNGSQIRPTEESHIDYHVISNFWWWSAWWIPWWWGWFDVEPTNDWVVAWRGRVGKLTYSSVSWMPSLANATKIQIVIKYSWTPDLSIREPLNAELKSEWTTLESWWGEVTYWNSSWGWGHTIHVYGSGKFSRFYNVSSWDYTSTITYDLVDLSNVPIMSTTWPSWFSSTDATISNFTIEQVNAIKASNVFTVEIREWIVLKSVDFYIWNN